MVKPISSAHKYIERDQTDILNTQIQRKRSNRYPQHTIVLPLSMYLYVEDIGFTSFYDLCVEDIGFTPFYVFVC
jgi:hypothetical protein